MLTTFFFPDWALWPMTSSSDRTAPGPKRRGCSFSHRFTGLGILILRLFDLHVPPALAVGLLPFVVPVVDCRFAVAVGIGTLSLNMLFLVWRRLRKHVSHRLNGEAEPVEYVHFWMASCVMPPNAFDMFSATGPQLSAPWRDARYFGSL